MWPKQLVGAGRCSCAAGWQSMCLACRADVDAHVQACMQPFFLSPRGRLRRSPDEYAWFSKLGARLLCASRTTRAPAGARGVPAHPLRRDACPHPTPNPSHVCARDPSLALTLALTPALALTPTQVSLGSGTLLAPAAGLAASVNAAVRTWLGWRPERNLLERCWRGGG